MSLEEMDDSILEEIFTDFFNQENQENQVPAEEYGNFQVAERAFRNIDPDTFLQENVNKNTKKKTDSDMKLFNAFLLSKHETRHPEFIPPDQLNELICLFILGVTKKDGSEYEPTTLRGFVSSIDRHLKSKNSKMSVFGDKDFSKTRAVLTRKQQQLKGLGLGNKPKTAETLTEEHISQMIEAGTLGDQTPDSLTHSMWLICTSYFGMRTGKECHDLCWGDIRLHQDESTGQEFLMYDKERQTKTRSGSNPRDTRYAEMMIITTIILYTCI